MKKVILFLIFINLGTACSTQEKIAAPDMVPLVDSDEYETILGKFTVTQKTYKGFYNKYQASFTLLNSRVEDLVLLKKANYLQWKTNELRVAREKAFQERSSQAEAFLTFYIPDTKYNDLNKASTIWKIYLIQNGQKYSGKIKKVKDKMVDIKTLFAEHTRFSRAYRVIFNVPMSSIERGQAKILLTSSVGQSEFEFPPLR